MMKPTDHGKTIQAMFSGIAGRYDLVNRLMTLGRDAAWRRSVVIAAGLPPGGRLLDIGTGTGAIATEALGRDPAATAVGADFTIDMMRAGKSGDLGRRILWCAADAVGLPFADNTFDAVTSGYLIRNVTDPLAAFGEQVRVVRPGGRVVCLDTSPPPKNLIYPCLTFFLSRVIPFLGERISGDRDAYTYLPESTRKFMSPETLARVMARAGMIQIRYQGFMFGTMCVHQGTKPK
ncbi:MAG: ubiquinone/menaquinone biosynthesis methyltransferase [Desulfobacterales bacterium]|nr:ubiquinone/menaquinone biosynthesis methyltransferase [Desulfobacterales bacterium]